MQLDTIFQDFSYLELSFMGKRGEKNGKSEE